MAESESSSNDFFVGLQPGLSFFMSKKLALETSIGSLGYRRITREDNNDNFSNSSTNSFEFSFSLNASDFLFGLFYYF
jgi:hypothetical protein